MRNIPPLSKRTITSVAVFIVAIIVIGLFFHRSSQNDAWGMIQFQEYAPTYLPDALNVTNKGIDADYVPSNIPSHTTTLNLTLSRHSLIYEQADVMRFSYVCSGPIVNETCALQASPNGQRYIQTITRVPNQPLEQTVKWIKGSTVIQVIFNGESPRPYSKEVLGKMVDSFKSTTYQNLKVTYYDHSKI